MQDSTIQAIEGVWQTHLGVPNAFESTGVSVFEVDDPTDPRVSVVRLGESTAVLRTSGVCVGDGVEHLTSDLTVPEVLKSVVDGFSNQLGPAELFFTDDMRFESKRPIAVVEPGNVDLAHLLDDVTPDEAAECGLGRVSAPVSVVRSGSRILAACSWELWAPGVAHLCVLSHPKVRGQGLARDVAAHASNRALSAGLIPQWRCRVGNAASRALAVSLGFELYGRQLTLRF